MATTKITNPELFDLASLDSALQLPSGTTAERPTSPSTGEWRYNTDDNKIEFYDGAAWLTIQSEDIPPIPSEHFNTVLYTGNGSTQSITGVGFKPDLVWAKHRNHGTAHSHNWADSTRGGTKIIYSNTTDAQQTISGSIQTFDTGGFTVGNNAAVNDNGFNYVAWCWKANGGTTSSNTDGTNITSTVQVNSDAGFSIVKWTGDGNASSKVGHGLGVKPDMIISKALGEANDWNVNHVGIPDKIVYLQSNIAAFSGGGTNGLFGYYSSNTTTTFEFINGSSSVDNVNKNNIDYIAYCFHSVSGFSKFGSYTGNGSTNGPIINTGFEPAFILIKNSSSVYDWVMYDNKRSTSNPRDNVLYPNTGGAENSGERGPINFLSNGFQVVATQGTVNQNGGTLIYMAFASDPSASTPTLADSFSLDLYTGSGTNRNVSGLGFSPSLSWIKGRTNTASHQWFDTIRGATYQISSDTTGAQTQNTQMLTSFNTDGFSLGNQSSVNGSGVNYVAWSWKANSIPTINTDGTIQSVVSANDASGFSIVTYTGNSTAGATVGHGLSSAPESVIIKCLSTGATNWINYYESLGNSDYLTLNLTNDVDTFSNWFFSNATTFTLNQTFGNANTSGRTYVAYCFKSISGFSKIGSYTGTGSTGNSINVGFQPDWIMIKRTDFSGSWNIIDSLRGDDNYLSANLSNAEASMTPSSFHLTSTGFTLDNSFSEWNASGGTYIYMAFKQNPTPQPSAGNMSFLVVAGGGSGAMQHGGGGGAGGLRTSYGSTSGGGASAESDITLAAGTYTITVGAGANGVTIAGSNIAGLNGSDSSLAASGLTTITSIGGGGGSSYNGQTTPGNGGSGGGGGNQSQAGGTGTAGQGNDGGTGSSSSTNFPSGGGGGAGAVGGNGSGSTAGNGGAGLSVEITGSSIAYAGGAGGSSFRGGTAGTGGAGGGANGTNSDGNGNAGTANTGGGGSGATAPSGGTATSGAGGSGVVILRLLTSEYSGTTTGSPTVTTDGNYSVLTYTGSGTYVHS